MPSKSTPQSASYPAQGKARASRRPLVQSFVLGAIIASCGFLQFQLTSASTRHSPTQAQTQAAPTTTDRLADAIDFSAESLADYDIGRANLICANGLKGSEDLDIEECVATLDEWAARVKQETQRYAHQFTRDPKEYNSSFAEYQVMMLFTVLQQDLGVRYNMERVTDIDFRDSRDLLIHGILGKNRTGTCMSLPVLFVAIGRRLGYPMHLALSATHVYVRWEDKGAGGETFSFDATSPGFTRRTDEHYAQWPRALNRKEQASGAMLRSLTRDEEIAVFLQARGHCLEDNGRLADAQVAYAQAYRLAPKFPYALDFLAWSVERQRPSRPAVARGNRPSAGIPSPGSPAHSRWVDEFNEFNRRQLSGELPPYASPPISPNPFH